MLQVQHLTRTFGEIVAVDDVSFQLPAGAMVGFVGGNGAGKTTTMRMIMGLLQPDRGETYWQGEPITAKIRSEIGYMPEERGLYQKQSVIDQLTYLGQLKAMTKNMATNQAEEYLTRFGLADRAKDKLEQLSLGNQQRVQIIAALLGNPKALILDEPFSGLDPEAVHEMSDILREETDKGVPVLFSSHQLDLVERLCDLLVILSHGKVVAAGSHEDLLKLGHDRYRIVVSGDGKWVEDFPGIEVLEVNGNTVLLADMSAETRNNLLREGLNRGEVYELSRLRPTLTEIYREVTSA